ncbi:trigger factor [Sporolactobacillus terrae]|uniref:Trigger factor n=1 Tax=Sporolactobacillus terrae TaxID=269673 RepID=A0A410D9Y8_9BACL|nr:trigger factor [Sporolactobacillus terrae]QAA22942.1 trigger factor [Sporolactobacillus terrae]QAA25915.1 trigger factor [Sporolactobacillus terrae]UAK17789.1 trigger factor [Sporolactobacillus terrae]BBN99340.1 trigger factor [Sporolactobacillus terrae]
MTVDAKWEKKEGNVGTLTFSVDAESFNQALDKAFKKVVKKVNVPGFRKGRVPRVLFEQRFGVESLYEDAIDFVLPSAYSDAIDQTGIEPVDKPQVDIEEIGKGKKLVLKADVTVKPEVKLGDYKGLEVEEKSTDVTDEDVAHEIKHLQERYAELVVKEDGEIEKGDTAVIDFDGYVDDKPFEGGKAENYSLEIGSGSFIPGFEDQLIGAKVGAEKDVVVTFPEDYHAEELKGKEATFKVKVHEIKQKQLPELDDEFAKDVDDDVETFAELQEKIKNHQKEHREADAENSKRDGVVQQAAANADIDVPEVMITNEQDNMVKEFEQRLKGQGMTLEMYSSLTGTDEKALRDQMKEDAEKRVRANLTLEAIAKAESIEASDEEVEEELKKMADQYKIGADQIKAAMGGTDFIKGDLKLRKAVDFLVENSKPKAAEAK